MGDGLYAALAKLQGQLPHIAKAGSADTGSYSYAYATLPDLTEAVMPLLSELGLSFTCWPDFADGKLFVRYVLAHEGGDKMEGRYPLSNGTPQQIGSAITYARRYCLAAVTGVAPDEDDDGRAAEDAARAELAALHARGPEVDEHGAATFAEQTRTMYGHVPGVRRSTDTLPSDQWNTPAPHEVQRGHTNSVDLGDMAAPQSQLRKMFARYKDLNITDDDVMRADIGTILGRQVASRGGLSAEEVGRVNVVLLDRLAEATK